jgi:sterol desaturase/sphingolipid hydroxylase (fatty acid hydroxylase superfamily)
MQDFWMFWGGTSAVLIGTFWIGVGIYTWFDKKRLFSLHKIQPNRYASDKQLRKAARLILKHQIFILLPLLALSYGMFAALGMRFSLTEWPSIGILALQLLIFMLTEDFLFYWAHRIFHRPSLYKKIHKVHHEFVTPTAIASLYAHPLEFIVANSLPVMAGPLLLCALGMPVHLGTLWIWLGIRVLETLDGHSGYDFRFWFPHKIVYGSGARPHDAHHSKFNGNFASFFHHWDKWLGSTLETKARAAKKQPSSAEAGSQSSAAI